MKLGTPEEEVREERMATSNEFSLIQTAKNELMRIIETLNTEPRIFNPDQPPVIDEEHLETARNQINALMQAITKAAETLNDLETRKTRISKSIQKAKLLSDETEKKRLAEQETKMTGLIDEVLVALADTQKPVTHLMKKSTIEKILLVKDEAEMTDEMIRWHRRLNGRGIPADYNEAVRIQNNLHSITQSLEQAHKSLKELEHQEEDLELLIVSKQP